MSDDPEDFDTPEELPEPSSVEQYFIKVDGMFFETTCIKVTDETAYFKVDAAWVRKGTFPSTSIDLRDFPKLGIFLCPVLRSNRVEH